MAPLLTALAVLLTGCGGSDDSHQGDDGQSPTSSATPSPTEDPTPSALEGATHVEGPGFSFLLHPDYEKSDNSSGTTKDDWYRLYTIPEDSGLTMMGVDTSDVSRDISAQNVRTYLRSGGATQIRRTDDVQVMGTTAYHWVATGDHVVFNTYLIPLGLNHVLQINFERSPRHQDQKRIQQAMLESFQQPE